MFDISAVLEEIKASPYEEISVASPHTGVVTFPETLAPGFPVSGPTGPWKEKPGSLLANLERERNLKPIHCPENGEIMVVHKELGGRFVEAGTELVKFRHYLSRDEVLQRILRKALYLFLAPERAKYYFVPAVDIKVKVSGPKTVTVRDGEELFIMSRMKRETSLRYSGPEGVIYALYFTFNQNVDAGMPLIGVCPPDMVDQVEEVVARVQTEWKEKS
jgi:hypothetical protein